MQPETLFYTGSTTKAFTAAMLSLIVDDDENHPQVQWDTPVNQLIRDDFVLSDEWATNHITIEDMLSHRTGAGGHNLAYGGDYKPNSVTVRDLVFSMRYLPLTAEPRTTYQYCNMMYFVASHVIEKITGEWLGNTLKKKIWDPLAMGKTYFCLKDASVSPSH